MEKIIYHGSEKIINKPEYGAGNIANDYGRGFYCTENILLAKEWACKNNNNGFANKYKIDMSGLKICDLNSDTYNILNWLAVLTKNRSYWQNGSIASEAKEYLQKHYYVDTTVYDIVIGYRADDSYFSFAKDFVMGTISLQKLSEAMRLGKLGEQVMIQSRTAFDRLEFDGYEVANCNEFFLRKTNRDIEARSKYREHKKDASLIDDIYIIDIMRGRVTDDELFL